MFVKYCENRPCFADVSRVGINFFLHSYCALWADVDTAPDSASVLSIGLSTLLKFCPALA